MTRAMVALGVCTLLLTNGCDLLAPFSVEVVLVNSSESFDVDATLFIDDEQDIPEFLLTEVGERLNFVIPPGGTRTFIRSCDDLQAIVLDDADLLILAGIGPETNTDVLRDGDDFRCGDLIEFTFSHSGAVFDFDVEVDVRSLEIP